MLSELSIRFGKCVRVLNLHDEFGHKAVLKDDALRGASCVAVSTVEVLVIKKRYFHII